MTPVDWLDLGGALDPEAACLASDDATLSYAETQGLSRSIADSLRACGVREGDTVGLLTGGESPMAVAAIFGVIRCGATWTAADPAQTSTAGLLVRLADCSSLLFGATDAALARDLQQRLPRLRTLVCLDGRVEGAMGWGEFLMAGTSPALEH